MQIIELTDAETHDLAGILASAWSAGKKVKVTVQDGGINFKVGGGMWTAPFGYKVDSNGDRVVETPLSPFIERITIIDPNYTEPL